jgi:hypothetical protein
MATSEIRYKFHACLSKYEYLQRFDKQVKLIPNFTKVTKDEISQLNKGKFELYGITIELQGEYK